jgi:cytoskeletal protein RodZ
MNENTNTHLEDEEVTREALVEEEKISSGNGRLALIVGGIVALVVSGYALLPAQATRQIVNAMPGIELGDATVTGSRATEAPTDTAAATAVVAPAEAAKTPAEQKAIAAAKPQTTREAAAHAEAEEASEEAAPAEIEVEPVPAAEPAAPTMVTITGRILNENGRPLAGATVLVKGSKKAVGTDASGNYSLELPAGDNTLVYGYGGYEDQEIRTRNAQPVNVTLVPSENAGKRRRR